ncbi:MAG: hypothetical protein JEY99_03545 [Spirochaetales bacterium]|nr:hypothetical protein [Spirochaetales bacterium]
MRIPWLLIFKIKDEGKGVSLYILLPLIYLLFLPLIVLGAVVFALMVAFGAGKEKRESVQALIVHLPQLLAASWGTEIIVHSEKSDVKIVVK